ncbi:MAG: hypothetical protein LUH03_08430 [Oscillospiraceae bacterium]|nr:hypothetical protein [Oscillospiraceae bacterium]
MERQSRKAVVVMDIENLPQTRKITEGTVVIATEIGGVPDHWDVEALDGTRICYVSEKHLQFS